MAEFTSNIRATAAGEERIEMTSLSAVQGRFTPRRSGTRLTMRRTVRGVAASFLVTGVVLFSTPMSSANILVEDAERDLFIATANAMKGRENLAETHAELTAIREQQQVREQALATAQDAALAAEIRLGEIHVRLGEAESDRAVTVEEHASTRQDLIDTAIGAYIEGAPISTQMTAIFLEDPTDRAQSMAYAMVITDSLDERARNLQNTAIELGEELSSLAEELTRVEQSLETFRGDVELARSQLDEINTSIAELEATETKQQQDLQIIEFGVVLAETRLVEARERAEQEHREYEEIMKRINREMVAEDIPARAFESYRRAVERLRSEQPTCAIPWWFLAAIGRVESRHGTVGGSVIAPNGDVRPRIIGPRLDGESFSRILDTDKGYWDGDVDFDRAVGPMQFIPSTWTWAGADGNGDGVKDPHNFDDAALAAARYLCRGAGGHSLRSTRGMRSAAFSYNRSRTYVSTVVATAQLYGGAEFPVE